MIWLAFQYAIVFVISCAGLGIGSIVAASLIKEAKKLIKS